GAGTGLGQLPALALERVAGLGRRGADEQAETGVVPVRLAVGHARQVAERGGGADPVTLTAVGAVVGEVDAAERLLGETAHEWRAALVAGIGEQQLVAQRA